MSTVFPGFAGVVVQWFRSLLLETFHTSWTLIRITLPIIFIVKILTELGLINIITRLLDPLMSLVGLPGSMGLVWATALFTNIYAGMIVFAGLAASLEITAAQATIISSMMLFAHSLPVELAITRKAGVGIGFIAFLRMAAAMIYGMILYHACEFFGLWQQDAVVMFRPLPEESGWLPWLIGQGENLLLIVVIIFCLLLIMRVLRFIKVLDLFEYMLEPILPFFGMSRRAAPVTVVGMVVGLSYGGALIIREATSGKLARREVFNSLALMGLCHSLIEDTLLMLALGAKVDGVLWGRLVFSLMVMFLIVRLQRGRGHGTVQGQTGQEFPEQV